MTLLTKSLSPESEFGDERSISLYVLSPQIIEETATLSDHHQQPSATVMVVLVLTEMLSQVVDPLREQGYLDFG